MNFYIQSISDQVIHAAVAAEGKKINTQSYTVLPENMQFPWRVCSGGAAQIHLWLLSEQNALYNPAGAAGRSAEIPGKGVSAGYHRGGLLPLDEYGGFRPLAKQLRKEMTKEERHLWYDYLRTHPIQLCRKKILGKYIADFYSAEEKFVIELDGSQHYEDGNGENDSERTTFRKAMD